MDIQYKSSKKRNAEAISVSVTSFVAERTSATSLGQLVDLLMAKRVISVDDMIRIFQQHDDYDVKLV